ncbi:hypothetical protein DPMN_141387 [Dreissena polymorpha]|uniref:Uncharacterized protein n=1 Tax=Dreissena polymorpha TaxID=45954 RepID=A0A9D4JJV1_DREPO|nr:hypothetical protein DPMN_141387 [Dreissena polymorpha]
MNQTFLSYTESSVTEEHAHGRDALELWGRSHQSGRFPLSNINWDNIRTYELTRLINDNVMTIIFMLVTAGAFLNTYR